MGFFDVFKSKPKTEERAESETRSLHEYDSEVEELPYHNPPEDGPYIYSNSARDGARTHASMVVPYSGGGSQHALSLMQAPVQLNYRATKELYETGVDIIKNKNSLRIRAARGCANECGRYCDPLYTFDKCEECRRTYGDVVGAAIRDGAKVTGRALQERFGAKGGKKKKKKGRGS